MAYQETDQDETDFIQRMAAQPRAAGNPIPDCLLTVDARAAWVRQNPMVDDSGETREFKLMRSLEALRNTLARMERMGKIPPIGVEEKGSDGRRAGVGTRVNAELMAS